MPTRRTTISRAAATRRSIARCWGSTEKITEKIIDKRGEGCMTTTLHKGRLFWLGVLALFTAAASLAIRGAIASGLKAEWIDPIAPLQAGELLAAALGAAFLSFAITLFAPRPMLAPTGLQQCQTGRAPRG